MDESDIIHFVWQFRVLGAVVERLAVILGAGELERRSRLPHRLVSGRSTGPRRVRERHPLTDGDVLCTNKWRMRDEFGLEDEGQLARIK
jgi:hypothetical protein